MGYSKDYCQMCESERLEVENGICIDCKAGYMKRQWLIENEPGYE